MAHLTRKIETERRLREILDDGGIPQPDEIEYGETSIRCLWRDVRKAMIIDIADLADLAGSTLDEWPGCEDAIGL
jgi:hypothetical protein